MGETYGVASEAWAGEVPAPALAYRPPAPRDPTVPIALVGCGGISQIHLQAYRNGGFNVVALCSRSKARALVRAVEFYPGAEIVTDIAQVLRRDDIKVVDITTSPEVRPA